MRGAGRQVGEEGRRCDAIEEALGGDGARDASTRVSRSTADRLFHLRVAEATGNGALVAVMKMLWKERTGPLYKQLEHHYDSPALWHAAMAEHRAVLKAIAAQRRDAGARPRCSGISTRRTSGFRRGGTPLH